VRALFESAIRNLLLTSCLLPAEETVGRFDLPISVLVLAPDISRIIIQASAVAFGATPESLPRQITLPTHFLDLLNQGCDRRERGLEGSRITQPHGVQCRFDVHQLEGFQIPREDLIVLRRQARLPTRCKLHQQRNDSRLLR
jgi:hypothetical protein